MYEITNPNSNTDILFINKIIDLFGRSPTSLDISIDTTLLSRFSTTVSGNRDGLWTITESSVYPGGDGPVTKKYKYDNKRWYQIEDEKSEEID